MRSTEAFAPKSIDVFELLDGTLVSMNSVTQNNNPLYRQEVMLIQLALGVTPDGIIGPQTRRAARRAAILIAKDCG